MASGLYSSTLEKVMIQTSLNNYNTDTFYCMLVTASYVPQLDTDAFQSDVSGEIPFGGATGYLSGGKTLTGVSLASTTNGDSILTWDAANVSWTASTITGAAGAVIYNQSLSAATTARPLIAYIDFGGAFSTTSGTFEIQWNASGIFTLDLKP